MLKASTRVARFCVATVLVAGAGVLLWHRNADAATPSAAVADEIAALDLPSRTVELPTERARRVRDAIKQGDYAGAKAIYADVLATSHIENWRFYPFTDFIDGIADLDDPAFETKLNAWVAHDASDATPLLIRARHYLAVAWAKRGHDFRDKTSTTKLDSFKTYIDKALADCEAVLRLDTANPYAFFLRLRILHALGASQAMLSAFQEAIDKYPSYYPLYTMMLETLQPKWGGSVQMMYGFVDRYAGSAAKDSPLRLLYVDLYRFLLETAATSSCDSTNQHPDKLAACVSSAMQSLVTPELERAIPVAMQLDDHTDRYQFGVALDRILSAMMRWSGGDTNVGAILEIAATSLHSNTELKPDHPTTNNYVIDKLVAATWYKKGFFDNALQKAREALKDIDAATFPNEAARDLALSGVLEYASAASSHLGQTADSLAYDEAAISLGDLTREEQYACYEYYQLKAYDDAIRLCTRAIDHEVNVMEARYWRATAYTRKGDGDAALKDLAVVAASKENLGANAVIDMSMIYFGRNDNRGALDVLNKYDFLYDPSQVDKQNVAVGYNNRCYAYMELGELHKALDDCTASLKYGSIPDAYSKQLRILKLLNSQ